MDEITSSDALAVLEPIWTVKNETATRVRQRMETVMDWVVAHGYRLDNPAGKACSRFCLQSINRRNTTRLFRMNKWPGRSHRCVNQQPTP